MSGETAPAPAESSEWLSGIENPIGVAEYHLERALPEQLMTSLPTVVQLESELGAIEQVSSQEPGDEG